MNADKHGCLLCDLSITAIN